MSEHSALVAGVDSSTQSCKVLVCDAETGEIVRMGRAPHPPGTEVDPAAWLTAFDDATRDGLLDGVAALAVGGQQHGMVALDGDGEVVRPALLWNDTRSAAAATDLVRELGGPEAWAKAVGVVPLAAITVAKLRWLAEAEPENLRRVEACVLPHDWLTGMLRTGSRGAADWTTDRGDASGTGYWSAAESAYRMDLVELATGRDLALPRVAGPAEIVGETSHGIRIAAGTGDNMGAALGLGLAPGDVVVSLGTSGTAFARSGVASHDASGEVAGFADAEGGFLPLVCTLNAARVLSAGADLLGVDLSALSDLALQAPAGAGGLTLLPYLDGERTPNLPQATGTLHGLTRANATPANLARAAVEGMLLGLVDAVDSLRREGTPVARILLIGGAAQSPAVRVIAPELFGTPVVIPAAGEYVALGAARQAAWALSGAAAPPQWAVPTEQTLDPDDSAAAQQRARDTRDRYAEAKSMALRG